MIVAEVQAARDALRNSSAAASSLRSIATASSFAKAGSSARIGKGTPAKRA
jgi:hypothetical protein